MVVKFKVLVVILDALISKFEVVVPTKLPPDKVTLPFNVNECPLSFTTPAVCE